MLMTYLDPFVIAQLARAGSQLEPFYMNANPGNWVYQYWDKTDFGMLEVLFSLH